jgi:ribonucleoside-diphosphate reductase alpha chain
MAVLRIDHPDIEDFIACKTNENAITNFNISVGITDTFMKAVEKDDWWELRFPDVSNSDYRGFNGTIEEAELRGVPVKSHKRVKARELFDKIVDQAHHNGEPGVLFLDEANRSNPVPHLYQLEATNPCGEQWLGPYENCCLGSINLAQHFGPDKTVDWEKLRLSVTTATIFLDDVVDANAYVPAVPQLREAAFNARRIGLGIMGLGDLMYHAGIRYGSTQGQEFAAQVMEFVRFQAMRTSIMLAEQRGAFPKIHGSIYDPENLTWKPPQPIKPYEYNWGRPDLDWQEIVEGIRKHGIRNAAQTTIAPQEQLLPVAGCEGYGCEPVFALAYIRHVNDRGNDLQLTYTSPLFEDALTHAGIDASTKKTIIDHVMDQGTCQGLSLVPKELQDIFVVSQDITAEEHVRMQASMQAFVDNSLSKTVNFPSDASTEDVATAYMLAWKLHCKGITVYVTGSRQKVVLETQATVKQKLTPTGESSPQHQDSKQLKIWYENKKPRPRRLSGYTYHIGTPAGKAFVTINENGDDQPFEVFISTAKAGSETAAISEAIGRLISYVLRLASPVIPNERLKEVQRQLAIGGGRSLGFGPNRVRSLPDGVAQILSEYLRDTETETDENREGEVKNNGFRLGLEPATQASSETDNQPGSHVQKIGDLCPECGQAAVVNEDCRKCYACGHSEC